MDIPKELIFKQIPNGPMDNFQYLIGCSATNEVAIVDPAWDVRVLSQAAESAGYKVTTVLFTHGHMDHVNGLDDIMKIYDVPAYFPAAEADMYKPTHKNLNFFNENETLTIGNIKLKTFLTPGHSPGSTGYLYKNIYIAGDTIFIDGCGRCDLPGSDPRQQYHSLYDIVMKLPDETLLFTGHNYGPTPYDTLGEQKKTNPYLTCKNEEEFLMQRMGMIL